MHRQLLATVEWPGADQPSQRCLSLGWDGSSCLASHPPQGDAGVLKAGCCGISGAEPLPRLLQAMGAGDRGPCGRFVLMVLVQRGHPWAQGCCWVLQGCRAAGRSRGGAGARHCRHPFPFSDGSFPRCQPGLAPGGPAGGLCLRVGAGGAAKPRCSWHTGVRCWLQRCSCTTGQAAHSPTRTSTWQHRCCQTEALPCTPQPPPRGFQHPPAPPTPPDTHLQPQCLQPAPCGHDPCVARLVAAGP